MVSALCGVWRLKEGRADNWGEDPGMTAKQLLNFFFSVNRGQ